MESLNPAKVISLYKPLDQLDAIKGCLIGAFIGDAAGAPFEFNNSLARPELIEKAFNMLMSNADVGQGQGTDDTELAMALAHGLMEGEGKLDVNRIVANYGQWIQSHPFDSGSTTRKALMHANPKDPRPSKVRKAAELHNKNSESNGSLMRISPLACWVRKLEIKEMYTAIVKEQSLTHVRKTSYDTAMCYCLAIRELINSLGDRKRAINTVREWAQKNATADVQSWLKTISNSGMYTKPSGKICWVKIAFHHAFYHLQNNSNFENTIKATIACLGDTDTCACIAGALVGAAVGFHNIPEAARNGVLEYSFAKKKGTKRPNHYNVGIHFEKICEFLLTKAPTKLELIDS